MKHILYLIILFFLTASCGSSRGDNQSSGTGSVSTGKVSVGINIGDRAPELVFPSPDGDKIALSSLRGMMVLVDFWASWCSPCRVENPNLVRTYEKYRDKEFVNGSGFTIYGVSLDTEREAWLNAIENDELIWESHVSDLKGWKSVPAAQYGVMAIPMNFLLNGNGIIVAKNLRGDYLENKLKELAK